MIAIVQMEEEHLIPKKYNELSPSSLFKLSITTSAVIYGLLSVIALVIGSAYYTRACSTHIQLLMILEALFSIVIIPHFIHIIHKEPTQCSLCFFIITFTISVTFIFMGMLFIWPFDGNKNCPILLNQFTFVYFNMWWCVAILAILLFVILFVIYRKRMK